MQVWGILSYEQNQGLIARRQHYMCFDSEQRRALKRKRTETIPQRSRWVPVRVNVYDGWDKRLS
jgi:hypothetical protein